MSSGNDDKQVVQSQSATSEPWSGAQPLLNSALGDAKTMYESGGFEYEPFSGSTVAPRSSETQYALDSIKSIGEQGSPAFGNAFNNLGGLASSSGMTTGGATAANVLGGVATGSFNPTAQSGIDGLSATASGQFLQGSPELDNIISNTASDMGTAIDQSFGTAGRFGSGQHAKVLSDSIGEMSSNLRYANYAPERAMMDAAQSSLVSAGQGQQGLQMQGAEGLNNVFRGANQDLMSATGMLPTAFTAQTTPASLVGQVGSENDTLAGLELQDEMNKYYANQSMGFDAISRAMAIGGGAGALGGTTNSQVLQPDSSSSPWEQALGSGMFLSSLFL